MTPIQIINNFWVLKFHKSRKIKVKCIKLILNQFEGNKLQRMQNSPVIISGKKNKTKERKRVDSGRQRNKENNIKQSEWWEGENKNKNKTKKYIKKKEKRKKEKRERKLAEKVGKEEK
jgi:hypothetical protein